MQKVLSAVGQLNKYDCMDKCHKSEFNQNTLTMKKRIVMQQSQRELM